MNLPEDIAVQTKQLAKTEGVSVSALVAQALQRHLKLSAGLALGSQVLALVGNTRIGREALDELEEGRQDVGA